MSKKREWLIQMRKESGMCFKEIAKELDITTQAYWYIENGNRRPSPELAQKIGELFKFDWTKFFDKESS